MPAITHKYAVTYQFTEKSGAIFKSPLYFFLL